MDIRSPLPLLGGLSPQRFMRRHWQKEPLLVRQAWPQVQPPADAKTLFALAARDDVESRWVHAPAARGGAWQLRHGPLPPRARPKRGERSWTLLVQGLDLHLAAARSMLEAFRFVPDARLDDLMLSLAADGGGVGPHLDSYDVFLLQVEGRRRWRVGPPVAEPRWAGGQPLKLLRGFVPDREWLLEPGDMLYLPPLWGHDGVAVGDGCMTASIGFRASRQRSLAGELLHGLADALGDEPDDGGALYADPAQGATAAPGRVPTALQRFARAALKATLAERGAVERTLGELLTEPKREVWFQARGEGLPLPAAGVRLDRRTRMLYDAEHVFINGESLRAAGADFDAMRRLADERVLAGTALRRLSVGARRVLAQWWADGWVEPIDPADPHGAAASQRSN
jgi:50S ribosomal protein L16 3-hydroxylase